MKSGSTKNSGASANKNAPAKKTASANAQRGGKSTASNGQAAKKSASSNSRGGMATARRRSDSSNGQSVQAKSDAATGLRSLFEDMLKDIYWAEKALTKALPKMAKNATSPELQEALQEHLAVTQEQVERLDQVFEALGKPARAKKCVAMEGLIKEGEEIMQETEKGMVRDAGIIAGSQKIEHYEIASYGTLCSFAKTLGEDEVMGLLEQTLNEEKEADQLLTQVAESAVNIGAAEEEEDDEEDDDEEEEEEDEDE